MAENTKRAVEAVAVPIRPKRTNYPPDLASRVAGRDKRVLGDLFGLTVFGVNLTSLAPGAQSALYHRHSREDEFVYVVEGEPTLVAEGEEIVLRPGMCAGFPAGGPAHHLINRTDRTITFLEIGDRNPQDEVDYPEDDLRVAAGPAGRRIMTRKDGTPV